MQRYYQEVAPCLAMEFIISRRGIASMHFQKGDNWIIFTMRYAKRWKEVLKCQTRQLNTRQLNNGIQGFPGNNSYYHYHCRLSFSGKLCQLSPLPGDFGEPGRTLYNLHCHNHGYRNAIFLDIPISTNLLHRRHKTLNNKTANQGHSNSDE